MGPWWVVVHLLWIAPSVLAALGLTAVARVLDLPHASTVRLLASIVLALLLTAQRLMAEGNLTASDIAAFVSENLSPELAVSGSADASGLRGDGLRQEQRGERGNG